MGRQFCYVDRRVCTGAQFSFCEDCIMAQRVNGDKGFGAETPLELTAAHIPPTPPGHEVIRTVKRCRIYQIDSLDNELAFKSLEMVNKKGLAAPPAEIYRIVFDGQLNTDDLKEIFRIFNLDHPEGYGGRSLSVSDIVELYDEYGSRFYFCETFGFKEVPFKPGS